MGPAGGVFPPLIRIHGFSLRFNGGHRDQLALSARPLAGPGSRGPRLRGEGGEKGVRQDREAGGGGGEPGRLGSRQLATERAPPAGCPGQCKMTRALVPAFSFLAGELTVQEGGFASQI